MTPGRTGPSERPATPGEPGRPDHYRAADVEAYPAGGGSWVVACRDDGRVHLLDGHGFALLSACRGLRPLEAHAAAAGQGAAEAAAALKGLVGRGLLRGAREAERAWRQRQATPRTAISWVVVPTRDRPRTAVRHAAVAVDAARRHGRDPALLLADDARDPASADLLREQAEALRRRAGARVTVWDRRGREAFARRLAAAAGADPALVGHAVLGPAGRVTVGANRNAVLLLLAGSCLLSMDDDVRWQPARPPEEHPGVLLGPASDARDTWFFADRGAALSGVRALDVDLLAAHEDWLGRDPGPPLAEVAAAGLLDCEDPATVRALTARPGRVAVTATGTVGDGGWDNRSFHLFLGESATRRLLASTEAYGLARGRDLAQAVTRPTLARGAVPLMAGSMALHAEQLLPPFPPEGRAEDVAFGSLLDRCFPDAYAAHLPVLLPHDPPGARGWDSGPMASAASGSWMAAVLRSADPGGSPDPARRLARVGGVLRDLAAAPGPAFAEEVRHHARASLCALVADLERRAGALLPGVPPAYVRDVERFVEAARREAVTGDPCAGAAPAALQAGLDRLGSLLEGWHALWHAARDLGWEP